MRVRYWNQTILSIVLSLSLIGCHSKQVTGNGKLTTTTRKVGYFNQIKINGEYCLEIKQDNLQSVKVVTNSNIQPYVLTTVKNKTLQIQNKKNVLFHLKSPVRVQIKIKQLNKLLSLGNNQITASNLDSQTLHLKTNGAIQAKLFGKVNTLYVQASGLVNIESKQLVAKIVTIKLMGSGTVSVYANQQLNTHTTGNGKIFYTGRPKQIVQSIIGSGQLQPINDQSQ